MAATGVAAHVIGVETVHHFFHMDIHCSSRLESGTIEYNLMVNTDLININESSLLEMKPFLNSKILRSIAATKIKISF